MIPDTEISILEHCTSQADSRAWLYKRLWMTEVSAIAARYFTGIAGKKVLEVGAGVHNPLASALIALSWGAWSAEALEPSELVQGHDRNALICAVLELAISGPELVRSRNAIMALLSRFGFDGEGTSQETSIPTVSKDIAEIEDRRLTFDIVHSNATLEHVQGFEEFLEKLSLVSSPGALHVHKVDFIDHDYYLLESPGSVDPFNFLLRGHESENDTCNRIRIDDMLKMFALAGFELQAVHERWTLPFPADLRPKLIPQLQDSSDESLSTIGAVLVHKKL